MTPSRTPNLPIEEWRRVPSLPDIEASSHGRIRKKPSMAKMPNGGTRIYKTRPRFGSITSASKDARHLYFSAIYRDLGNIKVHFAVCEAFHGPMPHGSRGVRHLNENGLDNRPSNLKWDSQVVNQNDPVLKKYHRKRRPPNIPSNLSKREKRAGIYDSIIDIGYRQRDLRDRIPANDNIKKQDSLFGDAA